MRLLCWITLVLNLAGVNVAQAQYLANEDAIAINNFIRPDLDGWWREYTMAHLAMHDALNFIEPSYRTYMAKDSLPAQAQYPLDSEAAAIEAGYQVLVDAINQRDEATRVVLRTNLDAIYNRIMAKIPDTVQKTNGIQFGQIVAAKYIAHRYDDGGREKYRLGDGAGQFRLEDDSLPLSDEHWAYAKSFAFCDLNSTWSDFKMPAPDSQEYFDDLQETRCVGRKSTDDGYNVAQKDCVDRDGKEIRASEQDLQYNAILSVGYGTSYRLTRELLAQMNSSFAESLRLLAGVSVAVADGSIGSWSARMHFNHWRPRSAYGDPEVTTYAPGSVYDPEWRNRSGETVEFPEFPSGSQAIFGSAIGYLKLYFENEKGLQNGYDLSSLGYILKYPEGKYMFEGQEKTFAYETSNVREAMRLAGETRITVGDHFRFSVTTGAKYGPRIGKKVYRKNLLAPLSTGTKSFLNKEGRPRSCRHEGV
jgi:hypothetical protein